MTIDNIDFGQFEYVTFDCYGTLIDWERGLPSAVQPVLSWHGVEVDREEVLPLFDMFEREGTTGPFMRYRDVLRHVMQRFAEHFDLTLEPEEVDALAESLPNWKPFPDSTEALRKLKKRYKLAVISNVDEDLFAGSERRLSVTFDDAILAEQVGSYKPSLRNFEVMFERLGVEPKQILHVAQSVHHDIIPAQKLGMANVWVRRYGERFGTPPPDANPDAEAPDLRSLVAAIDKRTVVG